MDSRINLELTNVLKALIGFIIGGGITWAGWVSISLAGQPTRGETINLIQTTSPYIQDRAMIIKAVEKTNVTNDRLREAIENNTVAITKLQTIIDRD